MFSNSLTLLQLKPNLYLTDFLDIIIIALFIYSLFIFFRNTRTYMVFLGLAIALSLYVVARYLNLYLTSLTLRYFAGVSVIVFAIIFQAEIRKYFEILGLLGTRQIRAGTLASKSPSATEIIQACVKMAQSKIGALIVIQGNDNMDPFIEGGIPLDGVISEEVILSIFDPHSEGHDGALIINNNRIIKFGAHLPLSTNFKDLGKLGTRHSAALGLSENVDALCIVCSEEKGKISICREGKLKTLDDFTELEKEFEKYIKSKFSLKKINLFTYVVKHNFGLKLGALVFAAIVWLLTAYQTGIVEKSFHVPVTIENLPKDTIIQDYSPKEIELTLAGRGEELFSDLSATNLYIGFEASNLQNGVNKEILTRNNITIPAHTSLVSFKPDILLLTVQKYFSAYTKISVKTKGSLKRGLELKNITVTPEIVELMIPQDIPAPEEVITETIDISDQTESVIIPVKLIIPENIRVSNSDSKVNIALTIEKT
ncbi:TIGR00159 family protein [candidate division WWE3 bacterium RIFCSPHIGHO2_12_FULL_38_15]|uniref:Diadenylate cyclase n=1 Tax=candidate division WWE3 bacterium RIFCSPHIGHO2_02_FULL_38_14 TaxID=1802620 RepID=A0A1F4V8V0_UNCKA|nr:MAG: TIGR00159 family protein [candidate division WWE3 bacterium RIFCSPHIGHO2_01_FULL_38_45]OGC48399.1 MAG: TIGR00159 family protein [candidate division WWE3 bacterium RIFCSPHIGHO2_12_FULL_38_15]OGC53626.1 MAG: TIGR00159 family protein [candidate division WWE3 bacterium RIFCSPHIGHO2_02_FULL_38_14]OGC54332.1 MAG: TIGR00159 family protein [candidate division WWE3 bacterium RIFCSPLOWO2_01_FULL_37_24]HLB51577.1 diadenylate cyclase CdaA [Patescibacteria group bacterium]